MPPQSISVLMPTWNAMEFLERVLDALAGQRCDVPWDVHVIDSGSTDGTVELLEARAPDFPVPLHVRRIANAEFDHGDTRNQLVASSRGELPVLLTQDAIPSRPDWLATLANRFDDPEVGAAYCRNVARDDAELLTKVFAHDDPGYAVETSVTRRPSDEEFARLDVEGRRALYHFQNVASAVRRDLWERHPFPRTMMGEDLLIARGLIDAGYAVVYDAEATVDHSHDYGPEKMRWRGNVDGLFNAEWLDRLCVAREEDIGTLVGRMVERDLSLLRDEHDLAADELASLRERAEELRGALVQGLYESGTCRRRLPGTVMRGEAGTRLLLAADPEGPNAALAAALASELCDRGHAATVAWDGAHALLASGALGLLHVLDARGPGLALAAAARGHGIPVVVDGDAAGAADPAALHERLRADLCLVASPEAQRAHLDAGAFDPRRLVVTRAASDAARDEPIEAVAEDLEFRYRALLCLDRETNGPRGLYLDLEGREADSTDGDTELQDARCLLLRPEACARYDFDGPLLGPMRLELELLQLAAEVEVVQAGAVLANGVRVAAIPALRPADADRVVHMTLEFDVNAAAPGLELRADPGAHLRVQRVRVTSAH